MSSQQTALAKLTSAEDPAWQRIWLSLEPEPWKSLAIVPVGDDISSIKIVHGLAAVAWQQRSAPLIVADLTTIALPTLQAARTELERRMDRGERILIATRSLKSSPTTCTIAREADKAVLCVKLGSTLRSNIKSVLQELGAQHIVGTILLKPNAL